MPGSLTCFRQLAVVVVSILATSTVFAQVTEDPQDDDASTETSDVLPMEEPASSEETAPPVATPRELARALYREGEAAYKAGRYLEAVSKFKLAARQEPNPALSYNIALAFDAVGEVPEALHWYRDYVRRLPTAPDRNEVRASIRRLEGRLQKLGVQQVSIMSDPEGAKVRLDDEIVGTTPWTGQTTPGEHRVQLTLPGYAPSTVEFTLAEDRAMDVRLVLTEGSESASTARSVAPPPPPATDTAVADSTTEQDESRARVRARTWVLLGGGIGLLGTAAGFEVAR
jgi:tetratricopeptide (TPR) repeat protein